MGRKPTCIRARFRKVLRSPFIARRVLHLARRQDSLEGLLFDRQGALVQRLGLRVLALGLVQRREVVEALGHIGMIRTQGLFSYR